MIKSLTLALTLLFTFQSFATDAAGQCSVELELDPETNLPLTGNLDVINDDWNGAVEVNIEYVDGLKHGEEKAYYKSGALRSVGHWSNGLIDGITEVYFEDGSLMIRMNFVDGMREGKAVVYYQSGQLAVESYFKNDLLEGESKVWYESGELYGEEEFAKGLKFSFERFKEDGTPYFEPRTVSNSHIGSLG